MNRPAPKNNEDAVAVRRAEPRDTQALADMANALNLAHGKPATLYTAELIHDEAFSEDRICHFLIAEHTGRPAGYALYHWMFNSDLARRGIWLTDLFVMPDKRRFGVGRKLFSAVAAETVNSGLPSLWWGVMSDNLPARAFFTALGARDEEARILELDGLALQALASEATW
ncbi:GNAT family N-acetyltransferase [Hwanghaeella grinnelliae]|uniref:GNAT family N-acetyltransferase n=1 Tax=Hwanghaeella grinnelliae TaxID=2500179 RepID=A0A3S2VRE4_9PROT|nr:GNAT family N-acetyltransferase [Hwanghaeella grinnelliae]RVU38662.1 GNAT family N-acetyltransferase [Hwanghaeella grinnelliae]